MRLSVQASLWRGAFKGTQLTHADRKLCMLSRQDLTTLIWLQAQTKPLAEGLKGAQQALQTARQGAAPKQATRQV